MIAVPDDAIEERFLAATGAGRAERQQGGQVLPHMEIGKMTTAKANEKVAQFRISAAATTHDIKQLRRRLVAAVADERIIEWRFDRPLWSEHDGQRFANVVFPAKKAVLWKLMI